MSEEDEDHFVLCRPFAAAVQVAGVGNEVWGDQCLKTLGRFAKWTRQQWLSYLHPAAGCAEATILQGLSTLFLECLSMRSRKRWVACAVASFIDKQSPLLSMN